MTAHEIETLQDQVEQLDSATARRVARLVFECRANLHDALLAVELSDGKRAPARPERQRHWPWHRETQQSGELERARAAGQRLS